MQENIKHIRDLSWYRSKEVQENAINTLVSIEKEFITFLANQEILSKDCWENATIVLKRIGYPKIAATIPYLMSWFQDLNWPGVSNIIDILRTIDKSIIVPYIEEAIRTAVREEDEEWYLGLNYLIKELGIKI